MKTIGIRDLKARLSQALREVAAGDVLLITDRGRVVAELRSPATTSRVIENGLACNGQCEERARKINHMIDSNSHIMRAVRAQQSRRMVFSCTMGIAFGLFGWWWRTENQRGSGIFFMSCGAIMLLTGLMTYTKKTRYPSPHGGGVS